MAVEKSATVELRLFEPGDATAFRQLNEEWIEKLFSLEEHDHEMLADPVRHIIEPGGQIVVAVDGKRVVGCCALVPMGPCTFEMVKLAVAEEYQGRVWDAGCYNGRSMRRGRWARRSCIWSRTTG